MTRTILVLAVVGAFVLGSIATGTIVYAAPGGSGDSLIVGAINALTIAVQGIEPTVNVEPAPVEIIGSDDLPLEFKMLASLNGNINPQSGNLAILFFGDTLCKIEGGTSYLIQFGMQTTVEHDNQSSCDGNGELISLEGNSDAVFQEGDILVLRSSNGLFTEVFRDQS